MIKDIVKDIREIPTLPQVTIELIQLAFQDEPDIRPIASIIRQDPTLTAKLLRTVNSAAFGLRTEITDIAQAISLLGLEKLRATIVTIALGAYFVNSTFGKVLDIKKFCMHSLATAIIMREMAPELEFGDSDPLYLIGILHDLGKVILDSLSNFDYRDVLKRMEGGTPCEDAERSVYGCDSREVWLHVAREWGFPSAIIERYEGVLEGKITLPTQQYIEAASRIADMLGYAFFNASPGPEKTPSQILPLLEEHSVLEMGKSVQKQTETLGRILELPAPGSERIQEVLLKTTHQLAKTTHQLSATNVKYKKVCDELVIRNEVLEELAHVFTGIIKSLDGGSLAFSVLESLIEGFRADAAFLITRNQEGHFSGYAARSSALDEAMVDKVVLGHDEISSSMRRCMQVRSPLRVENPMNEPLLNELMGIMPLIWLAPVYVKDRFTAILGIGVKDNRSHKFNTEEFGKILKIVSGEVGLSMENARLYNRVRKDAITDPLTKISSRRAIMKILATEFARFKRKGIPLSIAILDVDHFKTINDTLGHLAGDDFLMKIARLLKSGIRESDYIGRYGGDEFIAVFPDTSPQEARSVVERLRCNTLVYCMEFDDSNIDEMLSISAGVAGTYDVLTHSDDLLRLADKALYEAKQGGRNLCVLYDETDPLLKT
jgi:diguanylate cyclase (GGDEF)-like protein